MTNSLDIIRAAAMTLPEVEEHQGDTGTTFTVGGEAFAVVEGDRLRLRVAGDTAALDWSDCALGDDADWPSIEDRIARSWELAAPARLLEAGGR